MGLRSRPRIRIVRAALACHESADHRIVHTSQKADRAAVAGSPQRRRSAWEATRLWGGEHRHDRRGTSVSDRRRAPAFLGSRSQLLPVAQRRAADSVSLWRLPVDSPPLSTARLRGGRRADPGREGRCTSKRNGIRAIRFGDDAYIAFLRARIGCRRSRWRRHGSMTTMHRRYSSAGAFDFVRSVRHKPRANPSPNDARRVVP